ncbi:MAG: flagellar hook-basal body complex protein FliE [Chloroflexota bacterium]|jgi:flagellar hook-basal body complex protein FliE|nr:flagellar hook-basal body complex protein FliE [Gaiellales bacterium]MEA2520001.1 flagellar hook-basal body complex protein FliE [Chloroflexota bacterium]
MTIPIPPVGGDFKLPPLTGDAMPAADPAGGGFGKALAGELGKLSESQAQASLQAQQLATGQAKDISSVVMAVEKASLELQLAVQLRNKGVEAYQEIFRMQV